MREKIEHNELYLSLSCPQLNNQLKLWEILTLINKPVKCDEGVSV